MVTHVSDSTFLPDPVLVVDDLPSNRWLMGQLLRRLGIPHATAGDGTEAVALSRSGRFSAILMDLEMGELDGDAAARRVRRLGRPVADTPIIAVTSLPWREAVVRCESGGIDGILQKPVTLKALRAKLRDHARMLL